MRGVAAALGLLLCTAPGCSSDPEGDEASDSTDGAADDASDDGDSSDGDSSDGDSSDGDSSDGDSGDGDDGERGLVSLGRACLPPVRSSDHRYLAWKTCEGRAPNYDQALHLLDTATAETTEIGRVPAGDQWKLDRLRSRGDHLMWVTRNEDTSHEVHVRRWDSPAVQSWRMEPEPDPAVLFHLVDIVGDHVVAIVQVGQASDRLDRLGVAELGSSAPMRWAYLPFGPVEYIPLGVEDLPPGTDAELNGSRLVPAGPDQAYILGYPTSPGGPHQLWRLSFAGEPEAMLVMDEPPRGEIFAARGAEIVWRDFGWLNWQDLSSGEQRAQNLTLFVREEGPGLTFVYDRSEAGGYVIARGDRDAEEILTSTSEPALLYRDDGTGDVLFIDGGTLFAMNSAGDRRPVREGVARIRMVRGGRVLVEQPTLQTIDIATGATVTEVGAAEQPDEIMSWTNDDGTAIVGRVFGGCDASDESRLWDLSGATPRLVASHPLTLGDLLAVGTGFLFASRECSGNPFFWHLDWFRP